MIKQIAWNTFKSTGNIDAFLEFKNIEEIEATENENNKNQWNNNSGKIHSRL
ncbi:MAG: YqzL family protein [Oscillospiraceae bacterium]|nr:YqzL family protein [Oscillospiraceae bacterium]